jgi:hypothetical protein
VVGSSAMISDGPSDRLMAIITRCRIPPENWWGYASKRLVASGMCTFSSSWRARAFAACFDTLSCARICSTICQPIVYWGCRLESGSWKIMLISLPRLRRSCSPLSSSRFSPRNVTSPAVLAAGINPMADCTSTDLPDPDSPTMPKNSPSRTSNETFFTACTGPSSVGMSTTRSRTSRMAIGNSSSRCTGRSLV